MTTLAEHRELANRYRSSWMMALHRGDCTLDDLVEAARTNPPLRRILLHHAIIAQPGVGDATAAAIEKRFRILAARRTPNQTHKVPAKLRLGYLVDQRSGPELARAWFEARHVQPIQPWAGFPHQVKP